MRTEAQRRAESFWSAVCYTAGFVVGWIGATVFRGGVVLFALVLLLAWCTVRWDQYRKARDDEWGRL